MEWGLNLLIIFMQGLIRMLAGVLDWILSKPCLPHAGKGHCFRELTLSHTPHYGCWMGPGGVISGTHLRFSALHYPGSLRSIFFTRCHSGHSFYWQNLQREFINLCFYWSLTWMLIRLTRYFLIHAAFGENYCSKSRAAAFTAISQVIL